MAVMEALKALTMSSLQMAEAALERMYIEEYLRGKGLSWSTVRTLPEAQAKALLKEASIYASCRLAEIEQRARFVNALHGQFN